jgi:hypothetical protein
VTEKIAKIESTMLGYEDHGILTAYIHLDYGGSGQGAGGYSFDQWDAVTERRITHKCGMDFIAGVLRAAGVDRWEKLPGRTLYALIDEDAQGYGWGGKVVGFRPLPTENGSEFLFSEAFVELEEVPA